MSNKVLSHERGHRKKPSQGPLVLLLFLLPGLFALLPAVASQAHGALGARYVAAVARSVRVRPDLPPATLTLTQTTGSRARIQLAITSNASNVVVVYRTAGGSNRKVSLRLRGGVARATIPAGATGILAQAMGTSRLAPSPLLVSTPPRLPTPAPRRASPGPVKVNGRVVRSEDSITVSWVNPTDRDIQAIILYQSASSPKRGQSWDHATVLPGTATSSLDTKLIQNKVYTYAIVTVDRDLNVGPAVRFTRATLPDTTPPGPVGPVVIGTVTRNSIELNWAGNVPTGDVHQVQIRRTTGAKPPATATDGILVGERLWSESRNFTDTGLAPATQYSYSLFAQDVVGNVSVPTSVTTTTASWDTVAIGGGRTCALDTNGAAWCWGAPYLGNGTDDHSTRPVRVGGGHTFTTLTAGQNHTCGLDTAGAAWCWGYNVLGALGNGGGAPSAVTPVAVVGEHIFTTLTAGSGHTCGLDSKGAAWCWGFNEGTGALGDGTRTNRPTPVAVVGGHVFATLTAGDRRTCGVDNAGAAWCWGAELANLGGFIAVDARPVPYAVAAGQSFTSMTTDWDITCGVDTSGAAWCWGVNRTGSVGDGTKDYRPNPVAVQGGHTFANVQSHGTFTCGLDTGGAAWCWGMNSTGQLGNATSTESLTPTTVAGGHIFDSLVVGNLSTCGVDTKGEAWCWGSNGDGQLGDGTYETRFTPVLVAE